MRKKSLKALSIVMSVVMGISSVTFYDTTTKAAVTTEQMVASSAYNLALNKTATANPTCQEGSGSNLTNGRFVGTNGGNEYAATTFNTKGTYFEIDLGDTYDASTIDQLVVRYKEKNDGDVPVKGYEVQFSANGFHFTTVKTVAGEEVKATITSTNLMEVRDLDVEATAVRYVRLYYPEAYAYGIQASEIAFLDTDGNAAHMDPERCDNPAAVTVTSNDYNSITYSITAGENQEDYVYVAYLDDSTIIGGGVEAGKEYTVDEVTGGAHTVKVVGVYDGKISEGIVSSTVQVTDVTSFITQPLNLAYKYAHPAVTVTCDSDNLLHATPETGAVPGSQGIGDSIGEPTKFSGSGWVLNNGKWTNLRHHVGYLQTRPDSNKANIVYDLGKGYSPADIHSIVAIYEGKNNAATEYEVFFSATGKEGTYESVFYAKDVEWKQFLYDKVDVSEYTQSTVRYVKYSIINGNYAKHNTSGSCYGCDGYHLCELAVIGRQGMKVENEAGNQQQASGNNQTVTQGNSNNSAVSKPDRAKIKKVKVGKKKASLVLKRVKGAKGYKIQYSTNKKFKRAKSFSTTKLKVTVKKLKKGKRYYFRAKAFKKVNGKKSYGSWSKAVRSKKIK